MDATRFDHLTRRGFVLATGSAFAALFGWSVFGDPDTAIAGKKRKRRRRKHKRRDAERCLNLGETCTPGGAQACCDGRACSTVAIDSEGPTLCCQGDSEPCERDQDCCGPSVCSADSKICLIAISDRDAKANFATVDGRDMLARVRDLPISTWNYTFDDNTVRHIGPMAQDFAALFGVGNDDRTIHPMDGQGVALAAIQGLSTLIAELQASNRTLLDRVADLEQAAARRADRLV